MHPYGLRLASIVVVGFGRPFLTRLSFLVVCLSLNVGIRAQQQSLRPMEVDDLFKLKRIEVSDERDESFSPRGDTVAYCLDGNVWLYSVRQGASSKITDAEKDHMRFWRPVWSPQGDKLLMLSTRGNNGSFPHLWSWDRATGQLKPLGEEVWDEFYQPLWISNDQFVTRTLTLEYLKVESQAHSNPFRSQGFSILSSDTVKGGNGTSGKEEATESQAATRLVLVSISNGESRVLLKGEFIRDNPNVPYIDQSPSKKFFVAYSTQRLSDIGLQRKHGFHMLEAVNSVQLFTLTGPLKDKGLTEITSIAPGTVQWFPGKDRFVFIEIPDPKAPQKVRYRTYDAGTDQVQELETKGIIAAPDASVTDQYPNFARVNWDNRNRLIVYGTLGDRAKHRLDWWLIGEEGPINLTASMKESPSPLLRPTTDRSSFLMLEGGKLTRIYTDGKIEPVTRNVPGTVVSVKYYADPFSSDKDAIRYLILQTDQAASANLFHVDLKNNTLTAITRPDPLEAFRTLDAAGNRAVFETFNRDGNSVWVKGIGSSTSTLIAETNTFLRNIAEGEVKPFAYTSLNGERLWGWLILPLDYQRGKKYPLITWVYLNAVYDEKNPDLRNSTSISKYDPNNLQLWSAKGYAVLLPSMPAYRAAPPALPSIEKNPFMDLMNGVIPAVQHLVNTGVADPERLAVAGHSYGGFSSVGLIAQTKIFKSAIALAPVTNWLGGYGQLRTTARYADNADDYVEYPHNLYEQLLGVAPWKNPETYVRNSPLVYADRIETPLLLIHGDLDVALPMSESEQMYMALKHLGRKTRLIRYWGDGHTISQPPNIRHMWQQMFEWLEETGVPGGPR